jgi:hypothetical protein
MYNKRIVPAEVFCRVLDKIANDPKFSDQEIRDFIKKRLQLVAYKDDDNITVDMNGGDLKDD